jgi:tripartite-type tricarboxylate transporter receptor subunit TctC
MHADRFLRRRLIGTLAAGVLGASVSAARAQASSSGRPIRIIVGFPAGGPLDAHARLWAEPLSRVLGQPVIIDYKAGAGGTVGAQAVATAAPDGLTLLLANTGTMVINPALYRKLPYDTLRSFVPIARTAQQPLALVVHPDVPARTLPEFIDLLKSKPGRLNYGSAGNGGISHLVPEMLKTATGTFMVHIPYRGSAPAFTDLMAGQVQFMAESVPQAAQYAKAGKIRALAVTGRQRNVALPDVPTAIEAGLKDFEVVGFYGVLAPAGTPAPVVERLSQAFAQVLTQPEVRDRMISQGADPAFLDAGAFNRFLSEQMPRWSAAVKASGAQLD